MIFLVIIIFIFILACSAFCSAVETSITGTSIGTIEQLKATGNARANLLLSLIKKKDKVISTLLICNNLANTLCTTIATALLIQYLGEDLGTFVSALVMSFLIIIFAEVIPKAIAVVISDKIALFATPVLIILIRIFGPINQFLSNFVKVFCKVLRINLSKDMMSPTDEMRGVIVHNIKQGVFYNKEGQMLDSILDIRDLSISDIMIHRSKIISVNIDLETSQIIEFVLSTEYTRIPFWKDTHENIIGVLHIRDLLRALSKNDMNNQIDIKSLLSDPIFIPENASVANQLKNFQGGLSHLALAVDEYGNLAGMLTLEDILEEVFGQIYDEHDLGTSGKITTHLPNEYIIDATMTIRDINREMNWGFPNKAAITIGGFIMHKLERIPNEGDQIIYKNLKIIVNSKIGDQIKNVLIIASKDNNLNTDQTIKE